MTPIERRVLAYLDQRGGSARRDMMVEALASPDSRIGSGYVNGSNARIPQIAARWVKALLALGLVEHVRDEHRRHQCYRITDTGRRALREPHHD